VGLPNGDVDGDGDVVEFNLRFPGQYYDGESKLNYNYFRTYDSILGRFTTFDPYGINAGPNPNGYALQNPIGLTDPFGLVTWTCEIDSGNAALFVIGVGIARYQCESTCLDKKRTHVEVLTWSLGPSAGPALFRGVGASFTESRGNTITDKNTSPDTDVFRGSVYEASGTYTVGIGVGVNMTSFNEGTATGINAGVTGGVGMGGFQSDGDSIVVREWKEECCS
jgi:RHS repeat-associated protein